MQTAIETKEHPMRVRCPILLGLVALLAWATPAGIGAEATLGPAAGPAPKPAPPGTVAPGSPKKTLDDLCPDAVAANKPEVPLARARLHGAEWYRRASPGLSGSTNLIVQRRFAESAKSEMAGLPPARSGRPGRAASPEVVNTTEATEAQKIIDHLAGNYPDLLKGVKKVELVKHHDGSDFRRYAGGPEPIADSYSATPVVGGGGFIWLWGIYEKWPPGRYVIVYRIQVLSEVQGGNVCFCDVPKDGNTIASRRPAASEFKSGHWSEIPVPLLLREQTTIEYRLWTDKHQMGMDRLYVFRVPADDDRE